MLGYLQRASQLRARASLEHSKNILAHMPTYKYMPCAAWELLAKPTAHDLCSEFAIEMELNPVGSVMLTEPMWHTPVLPWAPWAGSDCRTSVSCHLTTEQVFPVTLQSQ